jgi:hypothetical protein
MGGADHQDVPILLEQTRREDRGTLPNARRNYLTWPR